MDHALFYIGGGALIVVALGFSLAGMFSDKFPSRGALIGGMVVIALLVGATAVGAVELSQSESEEGKELSAINEEGDLLANQEDLENKDLGDTEDPSPANEGAGPKGAVEEGEEESAPGQLDGAAVFVETGCGSCHSLAELGSDAQGAIGPNLDEALVDKDEEYIETAIVDPGAAVAAGYPDGTMPSNYGDDLTPAQITALVTFLSETAGTN